jgi:hypothetical protein
MIAAIFRFGPTSISEKSAVEIGIASPSPTHCGATGPAARVGNFASPCTPSVTGTAPAMIRAAAL